MGKFDNVDISPRLKALAMIQNRAVTSLFQAYLDEASLESDRFIVGLDITFEQAVEFVNDVLRFHLDGDDPPTLVKDPTVQVDLTNQDLAMIDKDRQGGEG